MSFKLATLIFLSYFRNQNRAQCWCYLIKNWKMFIKKNIHKYSTQYEVRWFFLSVKFTTSLFASKNCKFKNRFFISLLNNSNETQCKQVLLHFDTCLHQKLNSRPPFKWLVKDKFFSRLHSFVRAGIKTWFDACLPKELLQNVLIWIGQSLRSVTKRL